MSQEIVPQVFESSEFGSIRAMRGEDGEPWFVAKDVCDALGLDTSHVRRGLDDDEVATLPNWQGKGAAPLIVSEAGLYSLILKSRKPEAKRFRRWVTHEVLPALRRDGAYVASDGTEDDETLMARALLAAKRAIDRKDALIAEMRPKALFADTVAASDGTCLIGELAKMMTQAGFVIGQNRLFALLRDDGFLGKSGSNRNVPLQRYVEMGLFKIKETAITHADGHVTINRTPKVTGKGQRYFIERYCGEAVA
ncbi:MAG: phage antirepressor KilAC domain-containing protein [Atopobiaceae bacterium]|nr:phage antirepressor KilAC domain-containing protein [Atopobiaceae bacterium]